MRVANLLVSKLAASAILTGTLALAAGGATALSHHRGHDWHRGCWYPTAQNAQPGVGVAVSWACSDRDGDGR